MLKKRFVVHAVIEHENETTELESEDETKLSQSGNEAASSESSDDKSECGGETDRSLSDNEPEHDNICESVNVTEEKREKIGNNTKFTNNNEPYNIQY